MTANFLRMELRNSMRQLGTALVLPIFIVAAFLALRSQEHLPLQREILGILLQIFTLLGAILIGQGAFGSYSRDSSLEYLLGLPFSRSALLARKIAPGILSFALLYAFYLGMLALAGITTLPLNPVAFLFFFAGAFLVAFSLSPFIRSLLLSITITLLLLLGMLLIILLIFRLASTSWTVRIPPYTLGEIVFIEPRYMELIYSFWPYFTLLLLAFPAAMLLTFQKFDLRSPLPHFRRFLLFLGAAAAVLSLASWAGVTLHSGGIWRVRTAMITSNNDLILIKRRSIVLILDGQRRELRVPHEIEIYPVLEEREGNLFLIYARRDSRSRKFISPEVLAIDKRSLRLRILYSAPPGKGLNRFKLYRDTLYWFGMGDHTPGELTVCALNLDSCALQRTALKIPDQNMKIVPLLTGVTETPNGRLLFAEGTSGSTASKQLLRITPGGEITKIMDYKEQLVCQGKHALRITSRKVELFDISALEPLPLATLDFPEAEKFIIPNKQHFFRIVEGDHFLVLERHRLLKYLIAAKRILEIPFQPKLHERSCMYSSVRGKDSFFLIDSSSGTYELMLLDGNSWNKVNIPSDHIWGRIGSNGAIFGSERRMLLVDFRSDSPKISAISY